jgi:hypothetical protein
METTPDSIDRESQQLSGFSHRNFHLQPRCETDASFAIYQVARADDGALHCSIQAVVGLLGEQVRGVFGWLTITLTLRLVNVTYCASQNPDGLIRAKSRNLEEVVH